MAANQQPTAPYALLGGEDTLRRLVHRFYELMDTLPETWGIRQMHPDDLSGSEEKLFMFLSGWLGGPPLYERAKGHPRLRARHLPFPVGQAERDAWMRHMAAAVDTSDADDATKAELLAYFEDAATFMINQGQGPLSLRPPG